MCPDWESNWQPFGLQASAQPTELHQPGISVHFLRNLSKLVNFCAAILILKLEGDKQHFQCIMLYYFKKGKNTTEMLKMICAVCGEGAVTEHVNSGLRSFLALLTFWPNNSWLWYYLMHWKMFTSTPGLYPLEANSER